ncbi:MAG: hypothetical protein A2086_03575 [Spirochaetes bacterium GWD1_27_9]|nr:MAG: hypothetical protein A2Z98_09455 [Spirochaetes bacterium GWB1_27_13]OHD31135.1 MAG: hypothetical protein A2086_03575 [Spirochaetes bacterium GWD1_27_9]
MKLNPKIKFFLTYILPFFVLVSTNGIIFTSIIGLIYNEFSLIFLKIGLINSILCGFGVILIIFVSKILLSKIKGIFIILLSLILILGIEFVSVFLLFALEPLFLIYTRNIIYSYFIINFLFFTSITVIIISFIVYQKNISDKEKKLNDEILLRKQIEQKLYLSKINPHFLFNSLNLIISLLNDPKKAEFVILSLSDILRFNLTMSEDSKISIKDELDIVEKYLQIQKLRFEDRLEYKINCEVSFFISPFIIQPLVENCIKHNMDSTNFLKIDIFAQKIDNFIIIKIYDNQKRLNEEMIGKGIGLLTTKKRVEITDGVFEIIDGGIQIKFGL